MWTCLTLTWADCNRSTQPCTQSCTHTHMHTFPPQTPPAISSLMHFFKRIQLALTQRGSNMARWALIPGWWINPKMLWHTTKDWSCLFIPSAKYPNGPLNSISSLSIFFLCQLEFAIAICCYCWRKGSSRGRTVLLCQGQEVQERWGRLWNQAAAYLQINYRFGIVSSTVQ